MRVALVHDWLVAQRGGENVLLEMARLFPDAPIYTLVHRPGSVHEELEHHPIRTSVLQRLAPAGGFRRFLPLFPLAAEAWDLSRYHLVLSTSHCVAKGVRTGRGQQHLAYIHTPMRYIWDQLPAYVPRVAGRALLVPAARVLTAPLRRWDVRSARRANALLANSRHVADRIRRLWGREARVLYPPVDVDFFAAGARAGARRGFLVVSALVPYKRVDVAVAWATERGAELTVVGDGSERPRLEARAGPTVHFAGTLGREELREAYGRAEALLFCGVEDFGIVPVEAMAAGCPVVALAAGGALETVDDRVGALFPEPTPASLANAVLELGRNRGRITGDTLRQRAQQFGRERFVSGLREAVNERIAQL